MPEKYFNNYKMDISLTYRIVESRKGENGKDKFIIFDKVCRATTRMIYQ